MADENVNPTAESAAPPSAPQTPVANAPSTPAPAARPSAGERLAQNLAANPPEPTSSAAPSSAAPSAVAVPGAAVPPTPAQPAPQTDPFVARLAQLGFQGVTDPQEARDRLLEAYAREREQKELLAQQNQEVLGYAREYAQLRQDPRFQAFQQQYFAPQQAPQAPEHWWNAPQVDLSLLAEYREPILDETGKQTGWKWKADAPAEYQQQVNQYQHHLKQWNEDLLTRPHEILPKIIEREVTPILDRYFQQQMQQREYQSFAQNVAQNNADWLYARDPVTQQVQTDLMGNPIYSPDGQAVNRYLQEATQLGIADPKARWAYATRMRELELRRTQPQGALAQAAQAAQQPAPVDPRLAHLQNAAAASSQRGNSVPPAHDPASRPRPRGNVRISAADRLAQNFHAQGLDTVASPFV
jgi:hypothetical protein